MAAMKSSAVIRVFFFIISQFICNPDCTSLGYHSRLSENLAKHPIMAVEEALGVLAAVVESLGCET
jgi:hypothetical protein